MPKPKHILFISHDASKSGAPILLLNLIRLIKNDGRYTFSIVVRKGGALDHEFAALGKTIILKPEHYLSGKNFLQKNVQRIQNRVMTWKALLAARRADTIFSNTITNGRLLKLFSRLKKPVISYIHELEYAAGMFPEDKALTLQYTDLFLYPSLAVRHFLTGNCKVNTDKVLQLPYYFPVENIDRSERNKTAARNVFAEKYGLDPAKLWVVGMGTISDRKGIRYFLDTFEQVNRSTSNISFVWIGGYEDEPTEHYVKARLEKSGSASILFTGMLPHRMDTLLPFDVFFLSSKEDPYPLVVLEAAYMGIPAICFREAGGMPEFVGADCGWVVDDFSVETVTQILLQCEQDRSTLSGPGGRARAKVEEENFSSAAIMDKVEKIFNQVVS